MINMNGIIIGLGVFIIIGIFHPIVIKAEYRFGKGIWPVFLLFGIICIAASLFMSNFVASALLAALGFTFFWSIKELFVQEKRVQKGWFPANPERKPADKR